MLCIEIKAKMCKILYQNITVVLQLNAELNTKQGKEWHSVELDFMIALTYFTTKLPC